MKNNEGLTKASESIKEKHFLSPGDLVYAALSATKPICTVSAEQVEQILLEGIRFPFLGRYYFVDFEEDSGLESIPGYGDVYTVGKLFVGKIVDAGQELMAETWISDRKNIEEVVNMVQEIDVRKMRKEIMDKLLVDKADNTMEELKMVMPQGSKAAWTHGDVWGYINGENVSTVIYSVDDDHFKLLYSGSSYDSADIDYVVMMGLDKIVAKHEMKNEEVVSMKATAITVEATTANNNNEGDVKMMNTAASKLEEIRAQKAAEIAAKATNVPAATPDIKVGATTGSAANKMNRNRGRMIGRAPVQNRPTVEVSPEVTAMINNGIFDDYTRGTTAQKLNKPYYLNFVQDAIVPNVFVVDSKEPMHVDLSTLEYGPNCAALNMVPVTYHGDEKTYNALSFHHYSQANFDWIPEAYHTEYFLRYNGPMGKGYPIPVKIMFDEKNNGFRVKLHSLLVVAEMDDQEKPSKFKFRMDGMTVKHYVWFHAAAHYFAERMLISKYGTLEAAVAQLRTLAAVNG